MTPTETPVPVLLTGTWQIDLTGDYVDTCTYEIIQTGATIEGTMDCVDLGPGTFTGTIGVNGDFDITGALFGQTFAAQGTTDGETLRGSWSALPSGASGSLTGVMVEPESEVLGVSVPPIPETSASILAMDEIPINAAVIGTTLSSRSCSLRSFSFRRASSTTRSNTTASRSKGSSAGSSPRFLPCLPS